MSTRLRVATSGTMPATADDIGGPGSIGQILGRIANAIPGLVDTVGWVTPIPLTTAAPINVNKSPPQVGMSAASARADHKHDIDTGTPTQVVPGAAAAEGGGLALARAAHEHALAGFALPVSIGLANAPGIQPTFARSDHIHAATSANISYTPAIPANWLPVPTTVQGALDQLVISKAFYQVNAGIVGPASPITFTTTAITPIGSGVFIFLGTVSATCGSGGPQTIVILVDGVIVGTGQAFAVGTNIPFNCTLAAVINLNHAVTHTFGIRATGPGLNTAPAGQMRLVGLELGG